MSERNDTNTVVVMPMTGFGPHILAAAVLTPFFLAAAAWKAAMASAYETARGMEGAVLWFVVAGLVTGLLISRRAKILELLGVLLAASASIYFGMVQYHAASLDGLPAPTMMAILVGLGYLGFASSILSCRYPASASPRNRRIEAVVLALASVLPVAAFFGVAQVQYEATPWLAAAFVGAWSGLGLARFVTGGARPSFAAYWISGLVVAGSFYAWLKWATAYV